MATRGRVKTATTLPDGAFPPLGLPIVPPYPPMEAKRVATVPTGEGFQFEPKWDGFRAIVFRDGDEVAVQSKAGQPLGRYFPELIAAIKELPAKRFVIDGEIVVPIKGRLSFDDLLQRIHPAESRIKRLSQEIPCQLFVFDLLVEPARGGANSIADLPLQERRERLEKFFEEQSPGQTVKLSPATTDRKLAQKWFSDFGELGLDGVMAKRLAEPYHSGDRDGMMKVKHFKTADCVVGGFRYATGSDAIGSLLLGLYDEEGRLVFIGHTSSFNAKQRGELKEIIEPLRGENPFEVRVPGGPSRWASERSGEWVALKPTLTCEVEYDYFSQGRFRHGSKFLRWRPEKKPRECTMDQVLPQAHGSTLKKLGLDS